MSYESSFFKVESKDGVAHLLMNRPDKANAMSADFWEDLPRLLREIEADTSNRVVVISGEGKHFTSGIDLSAFCGLMALCEQEPARGALALREQVLYLQNSLSQLEQIRLPVIAAIHGACLGGGIDMITACDIRTATTDAMFGIEEINIGMTADVGTLQRLPKLIPEGIVRELTYTGRRFSAQEAKEWGLINSLHETQAEMLAAAMQLASDIAAKSPLAVSGAKHAINYARDHSVADSLEQIASWNGGMLRPEDLQSAMKAKMEKKAAVFADLLEPSKGLSNEK